MTTPSVFLTHGLEQARLALGRIMGLAGVEQQPVTLKRGVLQRAMGRLRQLEMIVRRLLVLMALGLVLAPVRVRAVPAGPAGPQAGVETKSGAGLYRLALSPKVLPGLDPDASVLSSCTLRASSGPVMAAPFLARLAALQDVLDAPEAHARRLARALERQRRAGEARPMALPMPGTHRMPPELGAIAMALPGMLGAALAGWDNSS